MTLEQITEVELATFEDACSEQEVEDTVSSCPTDDEDMEEEEARTSDYHELYLPFDTSLSDEQPIVFSGGMSYDQCMNYYRVLELEEARRTNKRRRNRFFLGRSGSRSSKAAKTTTTAFEFDLSANDEQNEDMQLVDSIADSVPCSKAIRRGSDASTASTASTSSSSSLSSSREGPSSRITFDDTVTVFKIPSIEDVPDDVWHATWKGRKEVRAHKKLSKKEYAWDGCDWENATEEDDMILDPNTVTLEHPVHYEAHFNFSNSRSTGPTFALRLGLSR